MVSEKETRYASLTCANSFHSTTYMLSPLIPGDHEERFYSAAANPINTAAAKAAAEPASTATAAPVKLA